MSLVGYCFGRIVLAWIAIGANKSKSKLRAFSMAAELPDKLKAERLANETFKLEKRAFFSKVRRHNFYRMEFGDFRWVAEPSD